MKKKICILHANCQGEPVEELLKLNTDFSEMYEVHRFTNYIKEPIPENIIADCDLFLYHHLDTNWEELSSAHICSKLKKTARAIPFPSMLFLHYWPLWSRKPGFDYPDTFLESLLERDLSESQILHLFMKTKLTNIYDFKSILEDSEKIERHKEAVSIVKYVDMILTSFRQKRLFNTINHPRKDLLVHIANTILSELGLAHLAEQSVEDFPPTFTDFEQPIHPQVAEYLELEFGGPEERYHVYGAKLTFEEYAMRYIKCRKHGFDDFIAFLQATANK
ncbi:WcbI family polysaccharide biosynthesis putative acetyltransferase [Maridesulfovibrio hydrothermalis]|uniref:Polysaccharide biosynthesis enzyme WcbI domain-containing protein n=1 Tax=Maridesulfovibrio hydrothermalis AM13 = DSM 14728 TaxID=1121451 RepID=L0R8K2_9BACT|nr:WcbI family polysaccharide biosynthesis putative acetyltransferase [Maridesulfovibrio hydrothermalis]CCO22557.1 conserved protein of unknown function [Maridesulfovibrio hydrothermalis AM13 = DSM 14728]